MYVIREIKKIVAHNVSVRGTVEEIYYDVGYFDLENQKWISEILFFKDKTPALEYLNYLNGGQGDFIKRLLKAILSEFKDNIR